MAVRRQRTHPLGLPGVFSPEIGKGRSTGDERARPSGLDRWLVRRIAAKSGDPDVAFALWDGEDAYRPPVECHGRIIFRDRGALLSVVLSPELGFGDAFSSGRIEVEGDLVDVLARCYRGMDRAGAAAGKRSVLGRLPKPRPNSTADHAATSNITTTWATTSTACGSTRRWSTPARTTTRRTPRWSRRSARSSTTSAAS